MPYNPSSAYPRHSTYIPPVYDRGFARGFNTPDWAAPLARGGSMPRADIGHALQKATTPGTQQHIATSLGAMGQRGMISATMAAGTGWAQQWRGTTRTRKIWNRAEYGDDPGEPAAAAEQLPTEIDTRTPEGRAAAAKIFGDTGGRPHVGGVSDKLGAIAAREETSTGMDQVIDKIVTGKSGGPMSLPKHVFGMARSRLRGGK